MYLPLSKEKCRESQGGESKHAKTVKAKQKVIGYRLPNG